MLSKDFTPAEVTAVEDAWERYRVRLEQKRRRLRKHAKSQSKLKELAARMYVGVSTLERFLNRETRRPTDFTLDRIDLILDEEEGKLGVSVRYMGELTSRQQETLTRVAQPLRSLLESNLRAAITEEAAGDPERAILYPHDSHTPQIFVLYDVEIPQTPALS